jgi:hypothetical protein
VTHAEEGSFLFWKQRMGTLIGIPVLAAFLVLVTARKQH